MRAAFAQIALIGIACAGVFGFVQAARSDERRSQCTPLCALRPTYAGRDRRAPDFTLPDMEGRPVALSSFRGKTVILNFWTKTCQPCLKEMPSLHDLGKVLKDRRNIELVTVSTDEGPEAVRETLEVLLGEAPSFTILFDPELEVVRDKFGTKLFPETWVIDPDGIIRARFDGERDWASPFPLQIAEMVGRPLGCPVDFDRAEPKGPFAGLCGTGD